MPRSEIVVWVVIYCILGVNAFLDNQKFKQNIFRLFSQSKNDPYTRSIIKIGTGEDINDAQQIGRHCLNKFEILRILRSGNVSC